MIINCGYNQYFNILFHEKIRVYVFKFDFVLTEVCDLMWPRGGQLDIAGTIILVGNNSCDIFIIYSISGFRPHHIMCVFFLKITIIMY